MKEFSTAEILVRIQGALDKAVDALRPFESGSVKARHKFGNELVTKADYAVNNVLRSDLPRDGEGWLSEESVDDQSRLESENLWIVDPTDGTREFVAGIPEWCVSTAYVRTGVAVAGGITNPATQETFVGSAGTGFIYQGMDVPLSSKNTLAGAAVLASRSEVECGEWEHFRNASFEIRPMGSVAYKLARVAAGLADATCTLTPKHEWDVAAGVALVEAAEGFVRTLDCTRPLFNQPSTLLRGLMVSSPKLESEMVSFLQPYAWRSSSPLGDTPEATEQGESLPEPDSKRTPFGKTKARC